MTGRIFDIQRFSIHDGDGIRTIVFFKGCFLRCKWCCNPESQSHDIEKMNTAGTIKTVGRDVTVSDIMREIERDRAYYLRSGGGLTLSGGEVLFQADFANALLMRAKAFGIDTAVESSGFGDVEKILKFCDTYLLDIKHINSKKHKEYTGQGNEAILKNAAKIAESDTRLVVRVPIIPDFNADIKSVQDIALFADNLYRVHEINLLPYHRLGQGKYEGLGRSYPMAQTLPPDAELMNTLLKAAQGVTKIRCRIGG